MLFVQITVIDCDLEIGQDLYSSFLRGIYKGMSFCCKFKLTHRRHGHPQKIFQGGQSLFTPSTHIFC